MDQEIVIEKYGSVEVTFSEYYKYSFTYVGDAPDGAHIVLSYGGQADDIYRHEVENNEYHLFSDAIEWASYVSIKLNGVEIYEQSPAW